MYSTTSWSSGAPGTSSNSDTSSSASSAPSSTRGAPSSTRSSPPSTSTLRRYGGGSERSATTSSTRTTGTSRVSAAGSSPRHEPSVDDSAGARWTLIAAVPGSGPAAASTTSAPWRLATSPSASSYSASGSIRRWRASGNASYSSGVPYATPTSITVAGPKQSAAQCSRNSQPDPSTP